MSEIKPALTEKEWAALDPDWFQNGKFGGDNYLTYDQRHAMAAKCLQYMPFGFTREDVESLRTLAGNDAWWIDDQELSDLADRIEALLPPENPS